jgi:bacillithiol disulfide reductase
VGGKNSAAIAALELVRAGATVTLVHRRERISDSVKYWIKPDLENRIKDGAIAARFGTRVVEIRPGTTVVENGFLRDELPSDFVFLLTGYHPEADLFRRAGILVDPESLKPQLDPATFETNVPGLFMAGSVVSGRETGRIFIENGRFHGEAIARAVAARRVVG